jgi:hypothetical protein
MSSRIFTFLQKKGAQRGLSIDSAAFARMTGKNYQV